jgi:type 1 glutamine amidotransferase
MNLILLLTMLAADPLRVRVVTGGHPHDTEFYQLFATRDFATTIDGHPSIFAGDLRPRNDVLVLYDMVQIPDEAKRRRLREFAEAGKGIVILHHAFCSYTDWDWYRDELMGGAYRFTESPGKPKSTYAHDLRVVVKKAAEHPILHGLPAEFTVTDELYKNTTIHASNKVLMRTEHPAGDGPLVWIPAYAKSRVVVILLGHDHQVHLDANYQRLVRNAILWAGAHDAGK